MIENLNLYIDHTNLKPDAVEIDIIHLSAEAIIHKFYSICINPCWVTFAKQYLQNSPVKICTVAGFPLGANLTDIKINEAIRAAADGADEIDLVANIGHIKSGKFKEVEAEITSVRNALPYNTLLKVIVETSLLTQSEQESSVKAVINGGAQFIKTSTGFMGGATVEAVERLSKTAYGQIKVKASGGIKSLTQAEAMIQAGAERLGCSSSVSIIKEYNK